MRATWLRLACAWYLCFGLGCGHTPKVQAPEPLKPPSEPLAWLPEDASLVVRVELAPLRDSPFWKMWNDLQPGSDTFAEWVDLERVDEILLGGRMARERLGSFVAALKGRFGAGYLTQRALADQTLAEPRGLLTIYKRPDAVWTQVSPELLVVCSPDRLEALVERAGRGPGLPIKNDALYRSLAGRLALEASHLAILAEDPEGEGREALKKHGARFGLAPLLNNVARAGIAIEVGANVVVTAAAETPSVGHALELERSVRNTLEALSLNIIVGVLGLRPALAALKPSTDGNYVYVRGSMAEADVQKLLATFTGMRQAAKHGVASGPPAP